MLAHCAAGEPNSETEARVEGSMMLGRSTILLIYLGGIIAVEVEVEAQLEARVVQHLHQVLGSHVVHVALALATLL